MNDNYQGVCYENIDFTTKQINMNFKIKVVRFDKGKMINERLVGVSGLLNEIGDNKIANSFIERAFNSGENKIVCKLRRGIEVIFFSH